MKGMCGRCYDIEVEIFPANCAEKPENLAGAALGMYHCPDCGAMVLAGMPHPELCRVCIERRHPGFDDISEIEQLMEFIGTIETYDPPSESTQKILGLHTILGTILHYGTRYYFKAGEIMRDGTTPQKLQPGCTIYFTPDGHFATNVSWKKNA